MGEGKEEAKGIFDFGFWILDFGLKKIFDSGLKLILDSGLKKIFDSGLKLILDSGLKKIVDLALKKKKNAEALRNGASGEWLQPYTVQSKS